MANQEKRKNEDDVIQPLAKAMANNEKRIRDKAVRNLRRWLSFNKNMSRLDLMKIWKALFYCMWMSDKRPVQQELAKTISKLVHCFRETEDAMSFVACFYDTINREWGGLDSLRMDKFLSLIRNVFCQTLVYAIRKDWEDESLTAFTCLVLKQMQTRNGLRRHLVDIFWNEIDRSMQIGTQENRKVGISNEIWSRLLDPFATAASLCIDRSFQSHVVENVFEILLLESTESEEQVIRPSFKLLSKIAFEIASDPDTVDIHRKKLYSLRRRFRKRAAKEPVEVVEDTVVEENIVEETEKKNDNDDDVVVDSDEKKKKKKSKKKKKKKKKRKKNEMTATPVAEEKKGVHFELQNNTEQSVTEAKKALRTPIPPSRSMKAPTSGILKKRHPATDPLKRSSEMVPKTPRRSLRKRKKRKKM
eukprot:g5383.t1